MSAPRPTLPPRPRLASWIRLAAAALLAALPPLPATHAQAPTPPPAPRPGKTAAQAELRWKNGDVLPGQIDSASPQQLLWKSPLFQSPLSLSWDALHRIDLPAQPDSPKDPFRFTTRDGSHLYGSLESISSDTVTLQSQRHGPLTLKRSEVLAIRRVSRPAPQLLHQGPLGAAGWNAAEGSANPGSNRQSPQSPASPYPLLTSGPGGALELPFFNQSALFPIELPPRGQLECEFLAEAAPQIQLTLRTPDQRIVSLESWDASWVLHAADSFAEIPLPKPAAPSTPLRFRLFWDLPAGTFQALSPEGSPIASLPLPPAATGKDAPGLRLTNKGRRLSLTALHLRATDLPCPAPSAQGILTSQGRPLAGQILALTEGTLTLRPSGASDASGDSSHPLDSLDALVFETETPPVPRDRTEWIFADGTFLLGEPDSIREGRAQLRASTSERPLPASLRALTLVRCRTPRTSESPAPSAQPDRLTLKGSVKLRGRFHLDQSPTGSWIPEGSTLPVVPLEDHSLSISLQSRPATPFPQTAALLHTRSGEILSGSLLSLAAGSLRYQSDFSEPREFPTALVSGLLLSPKVGTPVTGFSDPAWQLQKGAPSDVQRDGEKLEMKPGTALWLPNAMAATALEFEIESRGFTVLGLRFCASSQDSAAPQLKLISMGNEIRLLAEDTQLAGSGQLATESGKPTAIRLIPEKNAVSIFCNGVSAGKLTLPPGATGTGIRLEPAEAWGNGVQPVTLARFRAHFPPGSVPTPVVPPEPKRHALTVPRFRKDTPPPHALIAPNGDLLTGEIETATASLLRLRTGLETFTIPLARIHSLVWTRPLPPPGQATTPLQALRTQLAAKIPSPYQISGNWETHLAALKKLAPTLDLPTPPQGASKFPRRVSLRDVPLASVLEAVCSAFSLQYRLTPEGKILLELASSSPQGAVETRVYWLRESPFPASENPQSLLAQQGIPFPKDASLSWDPVSHTLTHTNTRPNLALLAKHLASTPDNLLGSPTHWLLLLNGTRLHLRVESFGSERITGFHPLLGKTLIPSSLLSEIRSSTPPPSASSEFLDSWQLVAAIEPQIPESSSASGSALRGKPAPDFKLPLLGGGDFELAKYRGKVVVLDFWASWCGPCVRALPELLEALAPLPPERFVLLGVNQGEAEADVQSFLQKRRWKLTTALDASQSVGKTFGVNGIPHTVLVAPDGSIAEVHTGYSPETAQTIADTIRKLLSAP